MKRSVLLYLFFISASLQAQEAIPGLGDILQWAIPAAGVGLSLAHEDPNGGGWVDREGLAQFAKSYGTTIAVTYAGKYGLDTERPNGGSHSFPSGHAASAFAGASYIQRRYGWGWGAPAYVAAGYTGYSRVANDAHYERDVIAAAAIATMSSYFFVDRYEKNDFQVSAYVPEEGGFGVQLGWKF